MDYMDFYEKMKACRLVSDKWRNLLGLLFAEIFGQKNADDAMKLFVLYFSLVDDGNTYMVLDEVAIKEKFDSKIEQQRITMSEETENELKNGCSQTETENLLDVILGEIKRLAACTNSLEGLPVISDDSLFVIDEKRLFARKYYNAVKSIEESAERLLKPDFASGKLFDLDEVPRLKNGNGEIAGLKEAQKKVISGGITKNLLVTGGPGTGKTTSVFFLLLALLCDDEKRDIYLTAPSGKAAARMSESINEEKDHVCEQFKAEKKDIIDRISLAEGQTIHRLLGNSRDTNGFLYNKENQLPENAIFVIDEASMIDVCLFASLLEAIPSGARVFILGDKNQLPSVECGAVYGELLKKYEDRVVELTEANRFSSDSEIFKLSENINHGADLEIAEKDFLPIESFEITDTERQIQRQIQYYADDQNSNKEIIEKVAEIWYKTYYTDFQKECTGIENDFGVFDSVYKKSEKAKILCALRETTRGAEHINEFVLANNYEGQKISGFYPGEVLMITKNLKSLDLYNGDCGVTVSFAGDETLYFMIKKSATKKLKPAEEQRANQIFRLGDYFFYPIRMIGREDISSAFAITVHKAQGSGYDDVFVILPKTIGHPLLNRQLVYTAITRTKKHAYIISNKENLEYSSKNVLSRNTGIRS